MATPRVVFWDNIPTPYGVERYNRMADSGQFDFFVWFSRRGDPDRSWEIDESTWRFPAAYVDDPALSLDSLHRFIRRCDALRPDLVVSLYGEPAFAIGHLVLKAAGIRTAFLIERTFDAWIRRTWWKETAKRILFRSADAAQAHVPPVLEGGIAASDAFQYARRYGFTVDRVFGVTHSLDVGRYAAHVPVEVRRDMRARLGLEGCVFLYVGRFLKTKGLLVLLDAYRRIQARSISLLLVGDGIDERELRSAAEGLPRVTFAGFVQPRDLPARYAAADVFVFPTLGDPFGLVIEEAHAAGLPVISSDATGDVRLRVDDGVSGFVVPAGDPAALADRMAVLAADAPRRASMGARGAERVRPWGHERWAADFEGFVHAACALPRRPTISARLTAVAGRTLVAFADLAARARIWREKSAAAGWRATARGTLVSRANRAGLWLASVPWRVRRRREDLAKLGTEYNGWMLPVGLLRPGGVCYSIGVGEDSSLEDDLLRKTGCRIWSFDPTPRAIAHVAKQTLNPARFTFIPIAVWDQPGTIRLFSHPDPACETYSPVNLWKTAAWVDVPTTTVPALMRRLGHDTLSLLKISIGGGEWRVLENILHDGVAADVLCVEFCQPTPFWRVVLMVGRLRRAGFRYCGHERWKFTFARADHVNANLSRTLSAFPGADQTNCVTPPHDLARS